MNNNNSHKTLKDEFLDKDNFIKSSLGGLGFSTGVFVDRILRQDENFNIAFEAGLKQGMSTFLMMIFSLSLYNSLKDKNWSAFSSNIFISSLSFGLNYGLQFKTGGSLIESSGFFGISSIGLYAHEKGLDDKILNYLKDNKNNIDKLIVSKSDTIFLAKNILNNLGIK